MKHFWLDETANIIDTSFVFLMFILFFVVFVLAVIFVTIITTTYFLR